MPKRTPRRRRASVSGASPERAAEPEAEPETEFGTPTATADVGAELAEVRANQAATATALETLLTQVASLTSAVAAAAPSGAPGAPRLPSSPPPTAPAPSPEPGSRSGHAGAAVLRALLEISGCHLSNCCGVSLWSTLATLPTRPARHNLTRWRCSCLFVCGSGRCRRCCGVGKMRLLWVFAADWLGLVTSSPIWLGSYPRVEDRFGSPEGNLRGSSLFGESFAWTIRTMT